MLGRKEIPPIRGVAFLCTFRSLGMSYNFLRLQKSNIAGVNTAPNSKLMTNTLSIYVIMVFFLFYYITHLLYYYCTHVQ